jgi:hypothetical protein
MTPRSRAWTYSAKFSTSHQLISSKWNTTINDDLLIAMGRRKTTRKKIGSEDQQDASTIVNSDTPSFILVVEGIKMGSQISINGIPIGVTTNQFRRYFFHIPFDLLKLGPLTTYASTMTRNHDIQIQFDPSIPTHGRYMASYVSTEYNELHYFVFTIILLFYSVHTLFCYLN